MEYNSLKAYRVRDEKEMMRALIAILFFLASSFLLCGDAYAQGWRGIIPLHSTRSNVDRLLGPPKESHGSFSTYKTKNEEVRVFYSITTCKDKSANWNVPLGTVIQLTVHPNEKLLVSDLNLAKAEYERVLDYHVQGIVHYFNRQEGIHISSRVLQDKIEDVDSITYWPRAADELLRCPKSRRKT